MALNSSGPISLAGTTAGVSIEIENGGNGTTQISLNDTAVRSLAGVPSGAITMPTDFYGKSNAFTLSITSDQVNANLRSLAVTAGWNQTTQVIATIDSGIYVYSNSTGTPGLTINGTFPGGVSLTNNGYITGMGGSGGYGAPVGSGGQGGFSGGLALSVSSAVTINNASGVIAGGGGGGGGGGSFADQINYSGKGAPPPSVGPGWAGGGGGGGQTGRSNSSGGAIGGGTSGQRSRTPQPGNSGTNSGAGSGGIGAAAPNSSYYAGQGGNGGSWGSSGSGGQSAIPYSYNWPSGGSGAAGAAVTGNSNITWTNTGTRYGGIS
jgi:hypothetical protein